MECYSRRTNLIIEGVPENGEDKFKVVCTLLSDKLNFHDVSAIDLCHRIGRKRTTAEVVQAGIVRPRPIIVNFCKFSDRMKVWRNRFNLKNSNLFLKEDFSQEVENERKFLLPIFRHCSKTDKQTRLIQNKITYQGKEYSMKNITQLVEKVNFGRDGWISSETQVLFGGRTCPFSNFFPAVIRYEG